MTQTQLQYQLPTLSALVAALREYKRNHRASLKEWRDADEPNVTLGFDRTGWAIQFGCNQYTGSAYGYQHWAVGYMDDRSNVREVARQMLADAETLIWDA